jgi:hypothetical protein
MFRVEMDDLQWIVSDVGLSRADPDDPLSARGRNRG